MTQWHNHDLVKIIINIKSLRRKFKYYCWHTDQKGLSIQICWKELALATKILQFACTNKDYITEKDKLLWIRNMFITNSLTHNVVSLFNFPQKAGSLPEKLVLEILLLPFFIVKQYRRTLQSELKEEKDTWRPLTRRLNCWTRKEQLEGVQWIHWLIIFCVSGWGCESLKTTYLSNWSFDRDTWLTKLYK